MQRQILVLALVVPAMAGCIGAVDDPGQTQGVEEPSADVVELLDDGGVQVDVPVNVVLIGYDDGVADQLADRLDREKVVHSALNYYRTFPPNSSEPKTPLSASTAKLPMRPVADYRIHDASELTDDLHAVMADATVNETAYDARAVEDWLAEALPGVGVEMDADTPTVVYLHAGEPGDHGWRYRYANGWLGPVRVFGEAEPFVAMDLSAREDPWVTSQQAPKDYDRPLPANGSETVDALHQATVDLTHFRLLQGAIYPITTKSCHAVTLILAVRTTAATEHLPDYRRAKEMLAPDRLESGWENATGRDNVHVDVETLQLPQDDPALSAMSRGSLATLDTFRWWLDANWEDYWVEHEGCEPYVSFLVFGDVAEPLTFGIATYDADKSHRISFSAAGERARLRDMYQGPGEDRINTRDRSRDSYDWVNLLYAHETGHLLGQRHPQDITTPDGGRYTWSFNSVHSAMSYQTGDRTVDFGAIDHANYARNRAGFLLQEARSEGLSDAPAFETALDHLRDHEWDAAEDALEGLLHGG